MANVPAKTTPTTLGAKVADAAKRAWALVDLAGSVQTLASLGLVALGAFFPSVAATLAAKAAGLTTRFWPTVLWLTLSVMTFLWVLRWYLSGGPNPIVATAVETRKARARKEKNETLLRVAEAAMVLVQEGETIHNERMLEPWLERCAALHTMMKEELRPLLTTGQWKPIALHEPNLQYAHGVNVAHKKALKRVQHVQEWTQQLISWTD